jgi:chromosomal replication initiator protein
MYLCRRYTDASLADIGRLLNRDHPSVANAIRKIERQLLENVRLRYQVEALIRRLEELGHRPLHTSD